MAREHKSKETHRLTLIEYLSNPDNEFHNRVHLSIDVLGFTQGSVIYQVFTPAELTEIENEALEARRLRYAGKLAKVDEAVLRRAASKEGTAADAKLAFQRYENWSEKSIQELKLDGPMLQVMFNILPPELANRIKAAMVAKQRELT